MVFETRKAFHWVYRKETVIHSVQSMVSRTVENWEKKKAHRTEFQMVEPKLHKKEKKRKLKQDIQMRNKTFWDSKEKEETLSSTISLPGPMSLVITI